ncbi:MAG: hypothetical protein IKD09_04950 [Lentisphaeria bacterium]|nr:hypothetical protein [Lentisphaeria bacterium]
MNDDFGLSLLSWYCNECPNKASEAKLYETVAVERADYPVANCELKISRHAEEIQRGWQEVEH